MIDRNKLAVTGQAALKLFANFLGWWSVPRATGEKKSEGEDQQGFHLEML